jgi:mxaJ protein
MSSAIDRPIRFAALLAALLAAVPICCCRAESLLRVCADPNNLPFSNQQQQGFENHLASMIAGDLGKKLTYVWYPERGTFFKKTLDSGICDVVMGVPAGMDEAIATRPYYFSSYAFLTRSDRHLHIASFDDPHLRTLRIGVHVLGDQDDSLPPVHALISRGIVSNLVGYSIFGNLSEQNPAADLIQAVETSEVDVAIVWGPLAGYFARQSKIPLDIAPVTADPVHPALPMVFGIGVGVRPHDFELLSQLDAEVQRLRPQIRALLASYGIPQVSRPSIEQRGN